MGDAKRRGTAEERRAKAIAGNESVFERMKVGDAPHYAFIIDKSPKGLAFLSRLKEGPGELRTRATSGATQLWEAAYFEYVVIWGTWGMTGGMTLQALDLESLLEEVLPKAMERSLEKGGLCTFIPAVDDAVLGQVMDKLAVLQPAAGNPAAPN